jgi:signal transduction histidine kinase
MNEKLQKALNTVKGSESLSEEEKNVIISTLEDTNKQLSVSAFKIERLEKVKHTTTVLLEQTINELETKRKAVEQQKRELEIEAALERVRARTMAMQHSNELADTAQILFQEFKQLGEDPIQITIGIFNEQQNVVEFRVTGGDGSGAKIDQSFSASMSEPTLISKMVQAWKQNKTSEILCLEGEELSDWIRYRNQMSGKYAYETKVLPGDRRFAAAGFFSKGLLSISTMNRLSEETVRILERFASVFDLTYTRFLDLKQAEANARESQIEAALEKVRGKAMAMHNSNDLSATASSVFTELRKLGINPIRSGVGILTKESHKAQLYSATSSEKGDSLSLVGWVLLERHPVLEKIYETWLTSEDYYPHLSGEQLKSYYELLLAGLSVKVPDWQHGQTQYGHFFSLSVGCLYAWSEVPYTEEEIRILKRFASIIDLTFRRYIELQKLEANARDTVKQAALDRVRAEIASMRTVNDLERITPLIWNELKILGIPFIRCGVFIMDDSERLIHTFLSTPDGKPIAAFQIPFTSPGNISHVLNHWLHKKSYTDHWDEKAFTEFADTLVRYGALSSAAEYLQTIPHGGFYLHFVPFLQGMLYVGNSDPLNDEEIRSIELLADAFSTAYARYEDFNKLELAKKQVDSTLQELKATQKQLIHSEKMASLGELTAGIAHEIQNPLNFVNNFAEINTELIQELKQEIVNGNFDEVNTLTQDLSDNNQKITFHGKRADSIVKGMLQHSRTTSGKKELTDINTLADEFLRLSYHGLRAKDKSFNASMQTEFDPSIGKIATIPQDLGRVLLNLFNNAFYSVNEKKKALDGIYEPNVSLSTQKCGDSVHIVVRDNGNGIPQRIIDKIYQPFFTTKPTGEGTGLGLSLSYDIITKGHSGELKVETKEGEFALFEIVLPVWG